MAWQTLHGCVISYLHAKISIKFYKLWIELQFIKSEGHNSFFEFWGRHEESSEHR